MYSYKELVGVQEGEDADPDCLRDDMLDEDTPEEAGGVERKHSRGMCCSRMIRSLLRIRSALKLMVELSLW